MFNILKKFVNFNEREVDRLRKKVQEINVLEDTVRNLADEAFAAETEKLKKQVQSGEKTLDELLPYAFALVREASRRVLGERHYDVQLMAGVALHEGKVAEQKTGEGKTLSATAPLYLNALKGKGVHLVTVNDYLARRDTGWMGRVYSFLGMNVAALISDISYIYDDSYSDQEANDWRLIHLRPTSRKEAYSADITYGINSEFGFDYLRDNMAADSDQLVQRGFNFAIIDEVDSVLIDEARTPHIISAPFDEDTSKYYKIAQIVKKLSEKTDYKIDEKARTAHLTEAGLTNIESLLGVSNIYESDFDTVFHIEAALKAQVLFKNNKDYIVKDNEVIIVDEFTGRLLHGRRFSEGLHQAIEAKENVTIKRESKTLATVSLQNYFRMYEKLAGMTGTAATEAEEFSKIYKLDVVVLPTHRDNVRTDHPDLIYKTEKAKFEALAEEVAKQHQTGRPVLVGTTSIDKNELLSSFLKRKGIKHELLNAKNHEREAHIISQAGIKGAVTVATNMAGRGVDIILGGEPPNKYEKGSEKEFEKKSQEWRKKHDEVVELGGLAVYGTERHESRRIDNQLRGRAGRQGDPGETRFYVSLQDDLMRIFGGEQVSKLMTFFNIPEDQPLEHNMVSKALEQAQVKVEGFNFDIRKHLVDYDDVLNKQREIIYRLRGRVLHVGKDDEKKLHETVYEIFSDEVAGLVNSYLSIDDSQLRDRFVDEVAILLSTTSQKITQEIDGKSTEEIQTHIQKLVEKEYAKKENKVGKEMWEKAVKNIFITTIDKYWTDHLTAIDDLREGINLRGYAQMDPLIEYKNEAFSMFEKLVADINYESTRRVLTAEIMTDEQNVTHIHSHKPSAANVSYSQASSVNPYQQEKAQKETKEKQQVMQVEDAEIVEETPQPQEEAEAGFRVIPPGATVNKPGRNDPCWCGSGKKYKKCHYPN